MARASDSERGFIIVAVLWMVAALATLASAYAIYVANAAAASHVADDRLQAQASMLAGVELVAGQLLAGPPAQRPSSGAFALRLGRSKVAVSYQSEGARIDLNAAPKPVLAGLFMTIGLDATRAAYCADRIIGWRAKGAVAGENQEATAYRVAGYSYPPRQAPFQNVLELSLVLGITPDLVQRILPFVTLFNGRAEVDARTAAPEVLASLPGMNPEILQNVLVQRERDPANGAALQQLLGSAGARASIDARKATRVRVRVDLDDGRRVDGEAVILVLERGEDPYRVLSWRDDFDGPG
jgi:general secretion pathway protein K